MTTTSTASLRAGVIIGSVRRRRVADLLRPWLIDRLGTASWASLDEIDLREQVLVEADLVPGGTPTALGERLAAAEAFVLLVPEYNHSYPASGELALGAVAIRDSVAVAEP